MKKINALVMLGALLMAGTLASPAEAYDYRYNNYYGNNRPDWMNTVNRYSNRYLGQGVFGNRWNNNNYCDNSYNGYYGYNRPGLVTRIWNRIF